MNRQLSPESLQLLDATRELLKSFGYFVDALWHVDDVHFICEQQEIGAINDEEAMEVFTVARDQFDGEYGLSWPQLEKALRTYLHTRAALNGLCEETEQA